MAVGLSGRRLWRRSHRVRLGRLSAECCGLSDERTKPTTVAAVRPDAERIAYIVKNLRARDREEIFALRWDDNEEDLVRETLAIAGDMSWVWEWNGLPVAVQGSVPKRPGVWGNWCFGTEHWGRALFAMTRHARRFIMPALLGARFHRAEALSLASHQDARGWIEMLGGQPEGIMRGLGRDGQDYVLYRWTPEDVRRRWRRD